ncbi:MAG TPA: DUF2089 family protein [Planctomycetaceae bacterium]|nr:DUF2089 family protein [Planctomycetaceae bacterium]HIQ22238.1 DUF2089 family protein [Planctomycetota bacterium]
MSQAEEKGRAVGRDSAATSVAGGPGDWVAYLSEEDLAFIKRFILASGSLKAVAKEYGISYPTVRLRLDRLIEKIRVVEEHREASRFERLLRTRFADGKLDADTLRLLLEAHRQELEQSHASGCR